MGLIFSLADMRPSERRWVWFNNEIQWVWFDGDLNSVICTVFISHDPVQPIYYFLFFLVGFSRTFSFPISR